jgi:hypothetical protein
MQFSKNILSLESNNRALIHGRSFFSLSPQRGEGRGEGCEGSFDAEKSKILGQIESQ